jgi:hypothetical protein
MLAVTILAGCTSMEVRYDAEGVRLAMLDFYQNEIMDNLIRARSGLPFIHVDLSNLTATVQTKLGAQVGVGQTLNDTAARQTTIGGSLVHGAVGIVTTATQLAVRPFTVNLNPERDNQIAVTENPTFGDDADIYQRYIQFLNLQSPNESIYVAPAITLDLRKNSNH